MGVHHILKKEVFNLKDTRTLEENSMDKKKRDVDFVLNLPWPYLTQNEAKE